MLAVMQANVLVETTDLSSAEWLSYRRKGIGGSDIAAICGISKWKRPIHVYLDKIGELPESELGEPAEWGTRLEPLIADKFASEHPEWAVTKKDMIYSHPRYEWALGNIDRMLICPKRGRGILEIKTANEYLLKEWNDGNIPDYYYVQLQWYLFITGLDWGYFATLIGGNKYREYEVQRDDDMIEQMLRLAGDFWENHVLSRECPPFDGSDASSNLLNTWYPRATQTATVELEGSEMAESYLNMKQQLKILEEELSEVENHFKSLLGNYEIGSTGDYKIKWENRNRTGIDSKLLKELFPVAHQACLKTTHFRQFSIKEVS
ncbi:MAG: YqaJ viral recombinase family protein [Paenibacillaceae bacterium]